MLAQIVELSRSAQAALDREAARIQELRDLERDAPTVLTEIVPRIEAAEQRPPCGRGGHGRAVRDAPGFGRPVRGNLAEAVKGLAGARAAVEAGSPP